MNVFQWHLFLFLAAVFASEVISRVCYEGQEPGRAAGGVEYSWFLTENPTYCTAIEVGGLNTRRHQIIPREMWIGGDPDLDNLKGVSTEDAPSISPEMTSYGNISACVITTRSSQTVRYPTHDQFSQPLERLEFAMLTSGPVSLKMFLNSFGGGSVYLVELRPESSAIGTLDPYEMVCNAEGVKFPGGFWLTHNSGEIQVGKGENDTVLMHCQNDSFSDDVWSIKLESYGPAECKWWIGLPYKEHAPCPVSESEGL